MNILQVGLFILLLFLIGYYYIEHVFNYFKRKKILHISGKFPFGNLRENRQKQFIFSLKYVYDRFKEKDVLCGFYSMTTPIIIPIDLELVKCILIKDFNKFHDRGLYTNEKDDPLSVHLLTQSGERWRNMRNKLTPTFTSGRMKEMFPAVRKHGNELVNYIESNKPSGSEGYELKDMLVRFSTDVIGECAFGIECRALRDKTNIVCQTVRKIYDIPAKRLFLMFFANSFQSLSRRLGILASEPEVIDYFVNSTQQTVKYREENNVQRKDFLNILMELRNENQDFELTLHDMAAQSFLFFAAGLETSSNAVMWFLYEIAEHHDIQMRLREEICKVLEGHDEKVTYDALCEMKYLEMCINGSSFININLNKNQKKYDFVSTQNIKKLKLTKVHKNLNLNAKHTQKPPIAQSQVATYCDSQFVMYDKPMSPPITIVSELSTEQLAKQIGQLTPTLKSNVTVLQQPNRVPGHVERVLNHLSIDEVENLTTDKARRHQPTGCNHPPLIITPELRYISKQLMSIKLDVTKLLSIMEPRQHFEMELPLTSNKELDALNIKILEDEEFNRNLKFLSKLFKLFDIENDGTLLAQDKWIEHLKGRLTDEKQMDFAEQLESVAYVLCGEGPITYEKFGQIWHAKGILDKLYRLIDIESTNQISTNQVMEFISNLTTARPRTGFDKGSLERLEQLFIKTVGNEKEIRLEDFKKIVLSKNPFFTERVFQIFDKDNSGSISLQEFIDAIHQFAGQSPEDKIKFLFKVYDLDGDGLIQHKELQHVMRACMEENGMQFSEDQIEDLTMAMFEDADPMNRGTITYEALKNQLEKHGGLLENLSISIDRWLVPLPTDPKKHRKKPLPHQFTVPYLKNNYVFISFIIAFIAINVGLFISRAIQYRASNWFVIFARACGQCLNFTCAFVLVLMLRQCITFLRTRGFTAVLPLDQHIYLHKMTGVLISAYSLFHTIMHLFNFSLIVVNDPVINANNYTLTEWLLTTRPGLFGLVGGCANPTGIALVIILFIMFICSQPFVRRGGSFEVFYWTHLLYIPFWILVLFHGPNFWKWFVGPGLIYLFERILRLVWMRSERGKTYISSGILLPSKVTHLVIKRPLHFCFRPGDYVFVNIPAIAKYEWHPFTLSSAPEQEDYMWLHIRGVGEWTNRLYAYFEREQERLHNGEIQPMLSIPNSSTPIQMKKKIGTEMTPQKDFLAKNLVHGSGSFQTGSTTLNHKNGDLINAICLETLSSKVIDKTEEPVKPSRAAPGTSKLVTEHYSGFPGSNGAQPVRPKFERQISENKAIKKIQAQLQRTFSTKNSAKSMNGAGHVNEAFTTEELLENDLKTPKRKMTPEKKLQMLILHQKAPLEKSLSMPDMQNKLKKRERFMALREYQRSESERSFDEVQIRKARLQSLGLAYLSPQNKSLAQSFRYMRNKPTIIAFKTPSLENCENRPSTGSMIVSPGMYTQKEAEEGKIIKRSTDTASDSGNKRPVNYPVGKPLEIYIDGPYGAPSSHIFQAQHAILIATGIGVTPFASILQSIMHRYWKARHSCPRCNYNWASEIPPTIMNLRKVDFFWINRDQRSFEWFVNLLSQLEIEQAELGGAMERFLEMHMYITSALQKTDMKAVGLQLALDLLHQKEKRDLITGLKTRTNAGRPNWDKVFKQIQDQKKGKVTVFYCGPPQLAKTLRYKCDQYGFAFRKEIF